MNAPRTIVAGHCHVQVHNGAGGQSAVRAFVVVDGQRKLFQVVLAVSSSGGFARHLNGRQQ